MLHSSEPDQDGKDLTIVLSVQILQFGKNVVNVGEVSLAFLANEDEITHNNTSHVGGDETRIFCKKSTWSRQCKVLLPVDQSYTLPDLSIPEKAVALEQALECLARQNVGKKGMSGKRDWHVADNYARRASEDKAVQKALICSGIAPTLTFDVAIRKSGPPPEAKPPHKYSAFLDQFQADNLLLSCLFKTELQSESPRIQASVASIQIYEKAITDPDQSLDQKLAMIEAMTKGDREDALSELALYEEWDDDTMSEMYQKVEDLSSSHMASEFNQHKLKFVLQATRPHASTWRCALYGQVLKGKLSRPSKITLPPRSRIRRGIPPTSEWFSFLYPQDEEELTTQTKQLRGQETSNEEAAALESITKAGAFVYFSQQNEELSEFDLKLDAVKSVGEIQGFSTATITFKPWELISTEVFAHVFDWAHSSLVQVAS